MSFLKSNVIFEESDHTMITIAGEPGMGKTTLGAMCEAPLFIRAERGTRGLSNHIARLPVVKTSKELMAQLTAVLKEEHDYKTLVFDTITALDLIFMREIVASDSRASTINDAKGGYGAGFNLLADMHQRVYKASSMIMEQKGMNIVFLAHTDIKTINPPDNEPYMKYALRMNEKSSDPYVSGVDAVGFIRQEVFYNKARGARVAKVTSTEKRVIIFGSDPSLVSKNRFGITKPIPFRLDRNPLIGVIPGFDASNKSARDEHFTPEPEIEEEVVDEENEEETETTDPFQYEEDSKVEEEKVEEKRDNKAVAREFYENIILESRTEFNGVADSIDTSYKNGDITKAQYDSLNKVLHARKMIVGTNTIEELERSQEAVDAVPEYFRGDIKKFLEARKKDIVSEIPLKNAKDMTSE